jgi:hypothetical protein
MPDELTVELLTHGNCVGARSSLAGRPTLMKRLNEDYDAGFSIKSSKAHDENIWSDHLGNRMC